MKNTKRNLILLSSIPTLFISACDKKTTTSSTNCPSCPESKTVEVVEQKNVDVNTGTTLNVTYENGDQVSDTLHLLCDSDLTDGTTKKLKATFNQVGAKISFSSSDESIASVTSDGLITALKPNTYCKITVSVGNDFKRVFDVYTYDTTSFFGISNGAVTKVVDKEIENLTLPSQATIVNNDALINLNRVKRFIISEGYTEIKKKSTDWCLLPPYVEYIYISSTFQNVENEFWITPKLKQVEIQDGNTNYRVYDNKILYKTSGYRANYILRGIEGFDGNVTDEMIKNIANESGVTITNCSAFSFCGLSTIKDLVINPHLNYGKFFVFSGSSVETLSLPKSLLESKTSGNINDVTKNYALTPNLREVKIYDDETGESINSTGLCSIVDGNLYIDNSSKGLAITLGTTNGLISSNCKRILAYTFSGRKFVNKKLAIPTGITEIRPSCFLYTNLDKVYIPATATDLINEDDNYNSTNTSKGNGFFSNAMYVDGKLVIKTNSPFDEVTLQAMDNKLNYFFGSNENMVMYDGSSTSRLTERKLTFVGKGYKRFKYNFNVSEEDFKTL